MKNKLNFLDYFIIVMVLLVIMFGVSRIFFFKSGDKTNYKQAEITMEAKNLRKVSVDNVQTDGDIYNSEGELLGRVKSVNAKNYADYFQKSNGEYVYTEFPGKYTVTLTIVSEGVETVSGFKLLGTRGIGLGSNVFVSTNGTKYEMNVVGFKILD